ncbi:MAG: DegT/DnrJ/EryC1/StrS family aminotransferase [Candidatus Caenarcaniphilales bacterium]|nr:DegT/DnrJ/EryC1/StrS family aminotransferase [Candidatus Caenarcaniphilales bacterium]
MPNPSKSLLNKTQIPFIELRTEPGFQTQVQERWREALHKSQFIGGPALTELETKILDFTRAAHFIPCANGTDAMQIALRAVGIGVGDKVLLPDFTFWATYEAVVNVGALPVMVDISPLDLQMDFRLCERAILEHKPKAVLLVHLYGWCSKDLQDFRDLCTKYQIPLVEDAAQAMGTRYLGQSVFQEAQIATTSFYPAKVLGAAGDAGGIFCHDAELASLCRKLSNHGRAAHYGHDQIGWNSRLDEMQAIFLSESLNHLSDRIDSRLASEKFYHQRYTTAMPLKMLTCPPEIRGNGYLQVSLAHTSYQELSGKLKDFGIGTGNVYPSPISAQPGALNPILVSEDRVTYEIAPRIINLPLFPYMTTVELEYVCACLRKLGLGS